MKYEHQLLSCIADTHHFLTARPGPCLRHQHWTSSRRGVFEGGVFNCILSRLHFTLESDLLPRNVQVLKIDRFILANTPNIIYHVTQMACNRALNVSWII